MKYILTAFLIVTMGLGSIFSQTMSELAGRWKGHDNNFYILEVSGTDAKWKNESSQVWTRLNHSSGTEYKDEDGYNYIFDAYRGTVNIINPDNSRDVISAKKLDFTAPGGRKPKSTPRVGEDAEYRGAHGFLLTYRGSAKAPIGMALGGIGKKFGMYFAFRTSSFSRPGGSFLNPDSDNSKQFGGGDEHFQYAYTTYSVDTRGALTMGCIYPFKPFLSFSLGIGYGWSRTFDLYDVYDPDTKQIVEPLDYEDSDIEQQLYAVNRDTEVHSLEIELAAMVHYKVFNATLGVSTAGGKSPDLVLGVGFLFH